MVENMKLKTIKRKNKQTKKNQNSLEKSVGELLSAYVKNNKKKETKENSEVEKSKKKLNMATACHEESADSTDVELCGHCSTVVSDGINWDFCKR